MRRSIAAGASVLAVAVVSAWPPAAAAATPVAGGVYTLASASSGKCVQAADTGNGGLLTQVACSTTNTAQLFTAASQNGAFGLTNSASGKCLDVPYSSTETGTQLWQWTCGASANQTWQLTASTAAAGKYLVKSAANGLCVSNKDGSTAGNNPIVQEPCADVARMQWTFNQVGGTTTPPAGSVVVAKDGSGQYTTVQAAINAVPANNTTRRVISIKPGTYREIVTIPANKPLITLQGLGTSNAQTTIVSNRDAGHFGLQGSGTVQAYGRELVVSNLTITNDYDENTYETGDQALALYLDADRARFDNVRLLGDQDTFLVDNNARTYFTNSYIEGTVDFIFGAGIAVFSNSRIHEKRSTGGPLTAASTPAEKTYGFLFYKCTVTGTGTNNTTLGRPWRQGAQVLFRESNLSNTIRTAQPWTDMSTNTWQNARFTEYKNTGAGAGTGSNRPQLSDSQAANYTPQKYLAGADGWNPVG
ncbi:pectinesterase family protein [Paractinoplanes lichenicola]|uniref:Pectinesterase n=1 Tax=Paractinoplanes lichenicola TaxID=2802976 RepID=A0ABS1VJ24_9ACTN|nr:pectinesterase family protein [Actinoplanes lichenicola]MBL7253471.1 RICIN domain-containing protein [Actinoplanes lichenicola]